jgi:hypothetical protein
MAREDLLGYQNTKESDEARPVGSKSAFFMHFCGSLAQMTGSVTLIMACAVACPKAPGPSASHLSSAKAEKNWKTHLKERTELLNTAMAQMKTTHRLAQTIKSQHRHTLGRFQHFQKTTPSEKLQTLLALIQSRAREQNQKAGSLSQIRLQQAQAIDETWKSVQVELPEPFPKTAFESSSFQLYVQRKQQMKSLLPKYQKALTEIARVEQAVIAVRLLETKTPFIDAGSNR